MYPFNSETNWVINNGVPSYTRLCHQKSRYLLFRRTKKFLLKKGLRKAHTIPRFPPRPPTHEGDFCSEVSDIKCPHSTVNFMEERM